MEYILTQRTCGTIQPPVTSNTGGCCGGGCGTSAPSSAPAPVATPPDVAVAYEPPTGGGSTGPTYEPESD